MTNTLASPLSLVWMYSMYMYMYIHVHVHVHACTSTCIVENAYIACTPDFQPCHVYSLYVYV